MNKTPDTTPANPFAWTHDVADIPANGLTEERAATADERQALAAELGALSFEDVTARYRITAIAGGAYRLKGSVTAAVTQACVVSLDPIPATLDETFDVEFWPEATARDEDKDNSTELSVLDGPDVEHLDNQTVAAGRIVFETISAAIDPFPRKPGATFAPPAAAPPGGATISPFAALSKLKNKG